MIQYDTIIISQKRKMMNMNAYWSRQKNIIHTATHRNDDNPTTISSYDYNADKGWLVGTFNKCEIRQRFDVQCVRMAMAALNAAHIGVNGRVHNVHMETDDNENTIIHVSDDSIPMTAIERAYYVRRFILGH